MKYRILIMSMAISSLFTASLNAGDGEAALKPDCAELCSRCLKADSKEDSTPVVESLVKSSSIAVMEDGKSIQEPGIFTPGCHYGPNDSISDHAPVLYGPFATWNVAGPISHYKIQLDPSKPAEFFFNHKFFTDKNGNLVNPDGAPVGGFLGSSEVALLKKVYTPETVKNALKESPARLKKLLDQGRDTWLEMVATEEDADEAKELVLQMHRKANEELDNDGEVAFEQAINLLGVVARGRAETTNKYVDRTGLVVKKIKEMFANNSDLKYMVLQEIPAYYAKTIAGEKIQNLIKGFFRVDDPWADAVRKVLNQAKLNAEGGLDLNTDRLKLIFAEEPARLPQGGADELVKKLSDLKMKALSGDKKAFWLIEGLLKPQGQAEELSVSFYDAGKGKLEKTAVSGTNYKKNLMPDVAIVTRKSAPSLVQEMADVDNRFVPWCSKDTVTCYVAAHMPFALTDDELRFRCQDMKNMAVKLNEKGYTTMHLSGDFNTHASRIAQVCEDILPVASATVSLHTSAGDKGNSCGSNDGHVSGHNIDIKLSYSFPPSESASDKKVAPRARTVRK